MHLEGDASCLAQFEWDLGVADELLDRAGDLCDGVAEVELNDFVACAVAGVGDGYRDVDGAVGSDLGGTQLQVGESERGVAEAVSEREQWSGVEVGNAVGMPCQGAAR